MPEASLKETFFKLNHRLLRKSCSLITVKNQLDISYLTLTQLLEIQSPEGFEIVVPEIDVDTNSAVTGNIESIYKTASETRPEVKSSELNLTASEYDLKIAKGGRSPSLCIRSFLEYQVSHT